MEGDETGVFSGMPVDTDHENHSNVPADTNLGNANQDMGNNHNNHDFPDFDSDLLSVHGSICRMSLDEMHVAVRGLTECQHKVFSYVVEQMNLDESTHIFISGGGGGGKSFLVDLIISWIDFYKVVVPGKRPVVVCAPTGTAARHVKGRTIHSLLKLPVTQFLEYVPLHPKVLQRVVDDFIGVHTVVIDEISMVSASMLSVISSRLSEITDCSLPFGGLNMIVVGDFFQLRPVCGRPALKNEILWNLFTPLFLRTDVRQCKDPCYGRLLNRARLGHLLPDDIDLLKTRLISIESGDVLDALHIFPTRDFIWQYNEKRQGMIDQPLVSLSAHHFFSDQDITAGADVPDHLIPTDERIAGGLPSLLQISCGSRVMLIRNVMTEHGLVNGAMGTVISFHYEGRRVTSVMVLFDDASVGRVKGSVGHEPIAIELFSSSFIFHGRSVVRQAFPLVPCWACTIHKVQGMTFEKVVADLGCSVFESGMAYVALSRVTSLDGLYLINLRIEVIKADDSVLEENKRLLKLTDNH